MVGAKKAYYKKNQRAYEKFFELIGEFLAAVEANGAKIVDAEMEPWPHATADPDWVLSKYYFDMPELRGEAGCGRIIFATNEKMKLAYPVMFYTHKEYSKRPPDKDLGSLIRQAMEDARAQQRAASPTPPERPAS